MHEESTLLLSTTASLGPCPLVARLKSRALAQRLSCNISEVGGSCMRKPQVNCDLFESVSNYLQISNRKFYTKVTISCVVNLEQTYFGKNIHTTQQFSRLAPKMFLLVPSHKSYSVTSMLVVTRICESVVVSGSSRWKPWELGAGLELSGMLMLCSRALSDLNFLDGVMLCASLLRKPLRPTRSNRGR